MASAFTLTLAYLGEQLQRRWTPAGAFAAYITGNVASNLFGRLISAGGRRPSRSAGEFLFLRGAQSRRRRAGLLHARAARRRCEQSEPADARRSPRGASICAIRALRAAFGIGFCILFAFIGTFTYVNFVLVRAPLSLGMMELGFVYFVFLPSIVTTPLAGRVVASAWAPGRRSGPRWRSPASACRCCCCPISRPCCSAWCWSASARSSRRRPPPASSAAPRPPIAASASGIYLASYFSADWSAAPCSARSSTGSAGRPASSALVLSLAVAALLAGRLGSHEITAGVRAA